MKGLLLMILGVFSQFVNPMTGTDWNGHTFPGAAYPFGMVQLSPDTRPKSGDWDGCSGYHYSDSLIYGFSHTHLSGTGCDDLCDILFMPTTGIKGNVLDRDEYASPFTHEGERATSGYYEVFLEKPQVLAAMTVGRRVGMHSYSFPENARPQIIVDLKHRDALLEGFVRKESANAISGHRKSSSWSRDHDVYFWAEFSEPMDHFKDCKGSGAIIEFKKDRRILVRIGISSVSTENARMNLRSELGEDDWSFERLKDKAGNAWEDYLGKIDVTKACSDTARLSKFYTALYHTAIHPSLYSDVNGEYRGMDRQVHKAKGFERYDIFSIWDTFRALHPLFCMIERERTIDFLKTFQSIFEECGKLPMWELAAWETDCMIGFNSVSVIADAMAKGIGGFDAKAMLKAMTATAEIDEYGRGSFYKDGAVLADVEHESVSKTLEYAYDCWCVAQVAQALGETEIAEKFLHYALHWHNIFDPDTGFMRPRLNGRWVSPFEPREVNNHFTEANSWQYSFFVPQDIEGHMAALGGDKAYAAKLDDLFNAPEKTAGRTQADITGMIGQYAHGNEPSHHIPYLYAFAGKPWKGQARIREIMDRLYTSQPDGLCGNEDCGQMSAWFVMSSLGFYSVTPGSDILVLGIPYFKEIDIDLGEGRHFTVAAETRDIAKERYVQAVRLNGNAYYRSFIHFNDMFEGNELAFLLDRRPHKAFGRLRKHRPTSSISGATEVPMPAFEMDNDIFRGAQRIGISGIPKGGHVEYTIDGRTETYKRPFVVREACNITAVAIDAEGRRSHEISTSIHVIPSDRKVRINSRYSSQYTAGGDEGLIDGVRGGINWRTGGWQGYQDTDFEAIIDLLKPREIREVGAGFCQDARSWIWMPRYAEFHASKDGKEWKLLGRVDSTVADTDYEVQIHDLMLDVDVTTRYVKVFAKNYGTIPDWHPGAGSPAFIFTDEIIVR